MVQAAKMDQAAHPCLVLLDWLNNRGKISRNSRPARSYGLSIDLGVLKVRNPALGTGVLVRGDPRSFPGLPVSEQYAKGTCSFTYSWSVDFTRREVVYVNSCCSFLPSMPGWRNW